VQEEKTPRMRMHKKTRHNMRLSARRQDATHAHAREDKVQRLCMRKKTIRNSVHVQENKTPRVHIRKTQDTRHAQDNVRACARRRGQDALGASLITKVHHGSVCISVFTD